MKNLVKYLVLIIIVLSMSGCARVFEQWGRSVESSADYRIVRHNGGEITAIWDFNGLPNSADNSDGYYFEFDGNTVEVSGDVDIYRNANEYTAEMWKRIYGKELPAFRLK